MVTATILVRGAILVHVASIPRAGAEGAFDRLVRLEFAVLPGWMLILATRGEGGARFADCGLHDRFGKGLFARTSDSLHLGIRDGQKDQDDSEEEKGRTTHHSVTDKL